MLFMMLFFMALYTALSIIFVVFVKKLFKKPLYKWLAIVFVILLPTWDVVFGYLAYYPACFIFSKAEIYETAETDGIYYEGGDDYVYKLSEGNAERTEEERTMVGSIYDVFVKGFYFAEAKVTRESISDTKKKSIPSTFYRCVPVLTSIDKTSPFSPKRCFIVDKIKSRYLVRVTKIRIGILEINLKRVYDRTSGKLMAKFNRVSRWAYFNFLTIPFFNWLEWADYSEAEGSVHCPFDDYLDPFEYKVLRPVK